MSLIKVRKIATLDSEAKDIQLPFIITFNNGKKEFREGYSEEEVRRRFDKSIAALYGGIKSVKLEGEDRRDGKDSIAADAKFKIGDKVRRGVQNGIVRGIEKEPYIEVKFTDEPVTVFVHESEIKAADSHAADAGDAAELRVVHAKGIGKWWVEPNLSRFNDADREQTHKGRKEFPDREAAMKYARGTGKTFIVNDACEDAAEFHVGQRVRAKDPAYEYSDGKALGAGMFTVKEVNNNGDVKLDDYGDVWISPSALVEANDACDASDAAEKGSRELQNVFYGALYALKKVADRAKVEGAQTLVDAANSAAKELTSKSYTVF